MISWYSQELKLYWLLDGHRHRSSLPQRKNHPKLSRSPFLQIMRFHHLHFVTNYQKQKHIEEGQQEDSRKLWYLSCHYLLRNFYKMNFNLKIWKLWEFDDYWLLLLEENGGSGPICRLHVCMMEKCGVKWSIWYNFPIYENGMK